MLYNKAEEISVLSSDAGTGTPASAHQLAGGDSEDVGAVDDEAGVEVEGLAVDLGAQEVVDLHLVLGW
jgi:hypothetical protein